MSIKQQVSVGPAQPAGREVASTGAEVSLASRPADCLLRSQMTYQLETAGAAWNRHQKIVALRNQAEATFLELGKELYWFEKEKQYLDLGYETFEEYIASPDIDLRRRTAFLLKQIYRRFELELKVPGPALLATGTGKLKEIVPHVSHENKDELLAQAQALSYHDLRKWLRTRFRPDKAELEPNLIEPDHSGAGWRIILGDMRDICAKMPPESFDAIVTDPPYPGEYLELFSSLAEQAARLLVPNGVLLVMSGQTHLPEVLERLTSQEALLYRWTVCYMMPGREQRTWGRRIWNHWKPVIALTKGQPIGDWTTDVVISPSAEKEHHNWGQSLKGMEGLIDAFVLENSRILDPFCGGGTTLVAARNLGHEVIGIDNDAQAVQTATMRMQARDAKAP